MDTTALFNLKEDDSEEILIDAQDVEEIVPDADFRFSLVILKNGEKHFICGTEAEIRQKLNMKEG
ncbi:hypothetical protein [Dyadobacter arcticus]|uniref:Uncharacterized protein n=1 Tax=Dyadobacter arcticus TaxID=1078754 RepID=A0ABX0UIG8_9BACT|nr:hypothetical protein [Dyadobacter arcticus]NIJ52801.1 hypothetical protein [Dyadobacter arcticus]